MKLMESGANTTDWEKKTLPLKNHNIWRVKIVGKLSDEWFGGIGVDDVDITGCTGKSFGIFQQLIISGRISVKVHSGRDSRFSTL